MCHHKIVHYRNNVNQLCTSSMHVVIFSAIADRKMQGHLRFEAFWTTLFLCVFWGSLFTLSTSSVYVVVDRRGRISKPPQAWPLLHFHFLFTFSQTPTHWYKRLIFGFCLLIIINKFLSTTKTCNGLGWKINLRTSSLFQKLQN